MFFRSLLTNQWLQWDLFGMRKISPHHDQPMANLFKFRQIRMYEKTTHHKRLAATARQVSDRLIPDPNHKNPTSLTIFSFCREDISNQNSIMKFSTGLAFLACASTSLAFAPTTLQQQRAVSSALNAGADSILSKKTGQSSLDPAVIDKYASLGFPKDSVLAEYVWVDAKGDTRSKTRTLPAAKVRNKINIAYFAKK